MASGAALFSIGVDCRVVRPARHRTATLHDRYRVKTAVLSARK